MAALPGKRWAACATVGAMGASGAVLAWLAWQAFRGRITVDLGWGRSLHPLGPIEMRIRAPRELVFEQIAGPYLGRIPGPLREKLDVLERGTDLVLAAHRTPFRGTTVTTVETVRFVRPERVEFRHVRGPVPHAVETFLLRDIGDGTQLVYTGELGLDLWWLGRWWAGRVVPVWNGVVQRSLEEVRAGAEARAAARARRG